MVAKLKVKVKPRVTRSKKVIPLKDVTKTFYDPARDGVTFSLLTKWKNCRERARLYLQGWTGKGSGMGLIFGTMCHALLQHATADQISGKLVGVPPPDYVKAKLKELERIWRKENPHAGADSLKHLELTMLLLEALLPLYFKFWKADVKGMQWTRVEQTFKIPFSVETRRHGTMQTFLRGKIDGNFRLMKNKKPSKKPSVFETKTKSRVDTGTLVDLLPHELQLGMYLIATMHMEHATVPETVLYNIIRRPGLQQRKTESMKQFGDRVIDDIRKRPEWYFLRMQMRVDEQDIYRHEGELQDMVGDFLLWWAGEGGHYKNSDHCENKYGRCEYLGTLCGGDRSSSSRDASNFYKRPYVFSELEEQ